MICNLAITLIHQTDVFLRKFIERAKDDFLKNGGIREQMTKARIAYRKSTVLSPFCKNLRANSTVIS